MKKKQDPEKEEYGDEEAYETRDDLNSGPLPALKDVEYQAAFKTRDVIPQSWLNQMGAGWLSQVLRFYQLVKSTDQLLSHLIPSQAQ